MCSVSWQWKPSANEGDELLILFNRDEQRSRAAALAPQLAKGGESTILCPIDPEKGGTWFAANASGLVIGILNNYREARPVAGQFKSRGNLVKHLAQASGLAEVPKLLEVEVGRSAYPAFTLLAWHRSEVRQWGWLGNALSHDPCPEPLVTSSSWESDRVENWRRAFYREKVIAGTWSLNRFHRHEVPGDEATSVCMTREKTQTVSLTSCQVTATEVRMAYSPRGAHGNFEDEKCVEMPIGRRW